MWTASSFQSLHLVSKQVFPLCCFLSIHLLLLCLGRRGRETFVISYVHSLSVRVPTPELITDPLLVWPADPQQVHKEVDSGSRTIRWRRCRGWWDKRGDTALAEGVLWWGSEAWQEDNRSWGEVKVEAKEDSTEFLPSVSRGQPFLYSSGDRVWQTVSIWINGGTQMTNLYRVYSPCVCKGTGQRREQLFWKITPSSSSLTCLFALLAY